MPSIRSSLFHLAIKVGREFISRRYIDPKPLGLLGLKYRFFDWLVFQKIRKRFGGRLKYFISGGAPLDKLINEFMWVIGIPTFEGYGLTETSPILAVNLPTGRGHKLGTVGTAIEGVSLKLDSDGEILAKGPNVMMGYYKRPDLTAEVMTED